jgi:outer membrane protein
MRDQPGASGVEDVGEGLRGRVSALLVFATAILVAAPARPLLAQPSDHTATPALTLDQALQEARAHNATLPVARLDVQKVDARLLQARGALRPAFSLDADLHGGGPEKYASAEGFFRLTGRVPLYDGGELRAVRDRSLAERDSLRAGERMAERDVDRAVRVGFSRVQLAREAVGSRQRGIERLVRYSAVIESRQAAGQGVGADLLRTRQRLAAARAELAAVGRDLEQARMELNDLLGRAPGEPLTLAPLPPPEAPPALGPEPWLATPEVRQSQADTRVAGAELRAAEGARRLHVGLEADAGAQPVLAPGLAPANNGTGWGAEAFLSLSFPLHDGGVRRGRVEEADAGLRQAKQHAVVVERAARLEWSRAGAALASLWKEIDARSNALAAARDAYLETESLYRGGQGSSLDVLDAYDAWIQAEQDASAAAYEYRVAEADLVRWGDR